MNTDDLLTFQLGDIIRLHAPTNPEFHEKTMMITYLDENEVDLLDYESLVTHELSFENGWFTDESIRSTDLLSRAEEEGYARQNGLLPNTWVSIHIGGDIPTIINGQITDLEQDMIQVKSYPDDSILYIDFGYKGIPKNIPIEKIVIRESPIVEQTEAPEEAPEQVDETEEAPEYIEEAEELEPSVQQIQEFLIQANDIVFGEELGVVEEIVQVSEQERKYDLDTQTNDLLNEMISRIPSQERTKRVMDNLHRILQRFRQLYELYSIRDDNYQVRRKRFKGKDYKPLVERLVTLNANLFWLLPVSKRNSLILESSSGTYINYLISLENDYYNKSSTSQNAYLDYVRRLTKAHDPRKIPSEPELMLDTVKEATHMIVESMDSLISGVYHNEKDRIRSFVIERFGLGIQRPLPISRKAIRINPLEKSTFEQTTPNDKANISSMVMLNYPAIQYSRAFLPNTSMYERATMKPQTYWTLLRQSASITQHNITPDTIENGLTYMENEKSTFLTDLKHIVMDEGVSDEARYQTFLQAMIPRTRELFELVASSIENKLSLGKILEYLEPFYIYQSDLTFTQYKRIREYMNKAILEWKRNYEQGRTLRKPMLGVYIGSLLLRSLFEYREVADAYDVTQQMNMTGWSHIMIHDGAKLLYTALAYQNRGLYNPDDNIQAYVDQITSRVNEPAIRIAKEYTSIDDLKADDFDGVHENRKIEYTVTRDLPTNKFAIVQYFHKRAPEEIARYPIEEVKDELRDYMYEEMRGRYKDPYTSEVLEGSALEEEIQVLLDGQRYVKDGDYAVLYERRMYQNEEGEDMMEKEEPQYYIRENGRWKKTEIDTPNIAPETKQQALEYIASQLVQQFDEYSQKQQAQAVGRLQDDYDNYMRQLKKYKLLREERENQSRQFVERLAKQWRDTHKELIRSPNQEVFQRIMGVEDFMLRQDYLVKFASKHTHMGDDHYYLCNETGVPLIPTFLVELANAYQQGGSAMYQDMLDEISARQGVMSDSGDAIVDKYSGYVIRALELSSEEGFDQSGFRVQSRDVLDEDKDKQEFQKEEQKQVSRVKIETLMKSVIGRYVVRVVQALTTSMGISNPFLEQLDFIARKVQMVVANKLPPQEKYEQSKPKVKYEYVRNELILFTTLAYLTVILQTIRVKTNKTFPGCVRSFKGYPMNGADPSTYTYVGCVAFKMRTKANPWSILLGKSQDRVIGDIKKYIDSIVLKDPQMISKMNAPDDEMTDDIPDSHEVSNTWMNFLPPLRTSDLTVKHIKQYNELLREMVRRGSSKQHLMIQKIQGRAILFSLAVQDEIQKVLDQEKSILATATGEPYLQNVCCEGEGATYDYFVGKNKKIQEMNENSQIYADALKQIRVKAPIYFDPRNTKLQYPPVSHEYIEENIYKAFIKYCDYNRGVPVSDDLIGICESNKSEFRKQDTLEEKIRILKSEGVNYTAGSLEQLLDVIHRRNYVNLYFNNYMETCRSSIQELLERFDKENVENVSPKLQDMLRQVLDTFDMSMYVSERDETYTALLNYLMESNKRHRKLLVDFLKKNGDPERKVKNRALMFLKQIDEWKTHDTILGSNMDAEDTTTHYLRGVMEEMCKELGQVYPTMISNNTPMNPYSSMKEYWKLGKRDETEYQEYLKEYYQLFVPFCGGTRVDNVYDDTQGEDEEADTVVDRSEILGDQESRLIHPVLKNVMDETRELLKLMETLPFLTKIGKDITSVFDARFIKQMMLYVFYTISVSYVNISKQNLTMDGRVVNYSVPQAGASVDGHPQEIAGTYTAGEMDANIELIQAKVSSRQKSVANFLYAVYSLFYERKRVVNLNYEEIHARILELKEKEKKRITDNFERMNRDQRNVNNLKKNLRLEEWSAGQQKGLFQYVEKTQDQEREEAEQQLIQEMKARNQGVAPENVDLYSSDLQEDVMYEQMIEREEYSMSGLPDDDDYGDLDGDERF